MYVEVFRIPNQTNLNAQLQHYETRRNTNASTSCQAAENFANKPSSGSTSWSVSQAAPLRRAYVKGDLLFGTYNGSSD